MMLTTEAVLLGLSTGLYCLGYCMPVLFPLFMANKQPSFYNRFLLMLKFSGGRLLAYMAFGAIVGYAGAAISNPLIQKFISLSVIIMALLLIFYGLSKSTSGSICFVNNKFIRIKWPVIFGFLSGFNICPPFLLALSYVSSIGEVYKGIYFFIVFFIVTNLYLFPLIFAGYFSIYKSIRWIARASAVMSGLLFLMIGISKFFLANQVLM